jgi:Tol biopolymer transport system component
MKLARPAHLLVAFVLVVGPCGGASAREWEELRGPYLGQEPPGLVPEIFAPGIVSTDDVNHCSVSISPDGQEIYWAMGPLDHPLRIYVSRQTERGWSEPEVLSFTLEHDGDCPVLSPDGQALYFNSSRSPSPGGSRRERYWVADRIGSGWSEPRPLGPGVNGEHLHWQASIDREGHLYFGSEREGTKGRDDIFVVSLENGTESQATSLEAPVNTALLEGNPYVAPDGSYLIFDREGLLISTRTEDGTWGTPRALGIEGTCPHVSPDGKYLFFLKMGMGYNDVYWVDASVLAAE